MGTSVEGSNPGASLLAGRSRTVLAGASSLTAISDGGTEANPSAGAEASSLPSRTSSRPLTTSARCSPGEGGVMLEDRNQRRRAGCRRQLTYMMEGGAMLGKGLGAREFVAGTEMASGASVVLDIAAMLRSIVVSTEQVSSTATTVCIDVRNGSPQSPSQTPTSTSTRISIATSFESSRWIGLERTSRLSI